jgi:arsenate reductase (thioredoxin)
MSYEQLSDQQKEELEHHVWRRAEILAEEFRGVFGIETIHRYIQESFDQLKRARIMDFVPVFVHRFSRDRLRALAQSEGRMEKTNPEILYVCVHNAGRSQMAALFTRELGQGRVNVRSAGSEPADQLNPRVVEAMLEIGLDMSDQFPKPLTDEVVRAADIVITMGCGDACPLYPGKRYLDWQLDDPAEADMEGVRRIRDEIRGRVEQLLIEMGVLAQA